MAVFSSHAGGDNAEDRHGGIRPQNRNTAAAVEIWGIGINPKTVAKRRKRAIVEDLKTGAKEPRSSALSEAEQAATVTKRCYPPKGESCSPIAVEVGLVHRSCDSKSGKFAICSFHGTSKTTPEQLDLFETLNLPKPD